MKNYNSSKLLSHHIHPHGTKALTAIHKKIKEKRLSKYYRRKEKETKKYAEEKQNERLIQMLK